MRRPSLRSMLLVPTLATIVVGFVVFAVAVDVSERALRLSRDRRRAVTSGAGAPHGLHPRQGRRPGRNRPASRFAAPGRRYSGQSAHSTRGDDRRHHCRRSGWGEPVHGCGTFSIRRHALPLGDDRRRVSRARFSVARGSGADHRSVPRRLQRRDSANLQRTLLLGGVVIVVLQGAVVWMLARRLTQPIAAATAGVSRHRRRCARHRNQFHRWFSRDRGALHRHRPHGGSPPCRSSRTRRVRFGCDAGARRHAQAPRRRLARDPHTPHRVEGLQRSLWAGHAGRAGALDRAMSRVGDRACGSTNWSTRCCSSRATVVPRTLWSPRWMSPPHYTQRGRRPAVRLPGAGDRGAAS